MTATDDDLGLTVEQHPEHGRWRWVWSNDAGAQRFGLFNNDTEDACRKAGRKWIKERQKEAQAITDGD